MKVSLVLGACPERCQELLDRHKVGMGCPVYAILDEEGDFLGVVSAAVNKSPRLLWIQGVATTRDGFRPAKQAAIRDALLALARSLGCDRWAGKVERRGLARLYERWGATVIGMDGPGCIYSLRRDHG